MLAFAWIFPCPWPCKPLPRKNVVATSQLLTGGNAIDAEPRSKSWANAREHV